MYPVNLRCKAISGVFILTAYLIFVTGAEENVRGENFREVDQNRTIIYFIGKFVNPTWRQIGSQMEKNYKFEVWLCVVLSTDRFVAHGKEI